MAVKENKAHILGSSNDLGDEVPRGVLSEIVKAIEHPILVDQSGRRQLAEWMTADDHPLTSRAMAIRILRWHFGKEIVATSDNFSFLGSRPPIPCSWPISHVFS